MEDGLQLTLIACTVAAKSENCVERTQALRMRAHDHFVSQKMTDCSSPKEESVPNQNRNKSLSS